MAISGGAKPSIAMRIVDGTLQAGTYAMRQGVVSDVGKAVKALLAGETVFVQTYGDLVQQVKDGVAQAMMGEVGG